MDGFSRAVLWLIVAVILFISTVDNMPNTDQHMYSREPRDQQKTANRNEYSQNVTIRELKQINISTANQPVKLDDYHDYYYNIDSFGSDSDSDYDYLNLEDKDYSHGADKGTTHNCSDSQNICTHFSFISFTFCLNGATCVFNESSCKASCICKKDYFGKYCHMKKMYNIINSNMYPIDKDYDYNYNIELENSYNCTVFNVTNTRNANCTSACGQGQCLREPNGYGMVCDCFPTWTGENCESCCPLDCRNEGSCYVTENNTRSCLCPYGFRGPYCEDILPQEGTCKSSMTCVDVYFIVFL